MCIIKHPADNDPVDAEIGICPESIMYDGPDIPAFGLDIAGYGYPPAEVLLQPQGKGYYTGEIMIHGYLEAAKLRISNP